MLALSLATCSLAMRRNDVYSSKLYFWATKIWIVIINCSFCLQPGWFYPVGFLRVGSFESKLYISSHTCGYWIVRSRCEQWSLAAAAAAGEPKCTGRRANQAQRLLNGVDSASARRQQYASLESGIQSSRVAAERRRCDLRTLRRSPQQFTSHLFTINGFFSSIFISIFVN